ncbi:hypothetical protein PoB_001739600 [Plakobranchus ocellatus]|uniref:Uncharacterized protein n=1 Tax=Plakobranchus ocellatus TaxID=259542 RepID=A0AAV3YUX4_9GAST|nr:hypothetical protein PoB_001739600 [Plakobranchus ocellatus]
MSSKIRLEPVIAVHEHGTSSGRHRHVHLEPMRPPGVSEDLEMDKRVGRKGSKPPPTAPRPKLTRTASLGRHHSREFDPTFAGYRPKDNLYNKTISWLKNLKPWTKHGNSSSGSNSHNNLTSATNGNSANHKNSLYFINSGTVSTSNAHHQPHYHYKSGKSSRLSSSISDRNLSSHILPHDDDAATIVLDADTVLNAGTAVQNSRLKSSSLHGRARSQNRFSTSFCPDRDYAVDPYIEANVHHSRDYSNPYDAYDHRYDFLNSQSCYGALPGGPQEYRSAETQGYVTGSQDYRSRPTSGRASQENLYLQSHFSHHDPLPHHHYQQQPHYYLQTDHSSNGQQQQHHHHHQLGSDRDYGDQATHYYKYQPHHQHRHDQQPVQSQQAQQQQQTGRDASTEELTPPQAAAVVSGNNVTRILRQRLFGRAKSMNLESGQPSGRHQRQGGGGSYHSRGMSSSHSSHSVGAGATPSSVFSNSGSAVSVSSDAVVKLRTKKSKGLMSSSEHVYVVNREEKMLRPRSCAALSQDVKLGEWATPFTACHPPRLTPGWLPALPCLHGHNGCTAHCMS